MTPVVLERRPCFLFILLFFFFPLLLILWSIYVALHCMGPNIKLSEFISILFSWLLDYLLHHLPAGSGFGLRPRFGSTAIWLFSTSTVVCWVITFERAQNLWQFKRQMRFRVDLHSGPYLTREDKDLVQVVPEFGVFCLSWDLLNIPLGLGLSEAGTEWPSDRPCQPGDRPYNPFSEGLLL